MVEPITLSIRAGAWVTAMAIESLGNFFTEAMIERGMDKWAATLRSLTSSVEVKAVRGKSCRRNSARTVNMTAQLLLSNLATSIAISP